MAAKKAAPKDLFMNFASILSAYAAAATTLVEASVNTGLSIRGALIWLVHQVEFEHEAVGDPGAFIEPRWALSTRQGLTSLPQISDDGVIAVGRQGFHIITSGYTNWTQPHVQHFLPPIPIATPALSLYLDAPVADAAINSKLANIRIGFTTAPLDDGAYVEVAEAWGW